VVIHRLPIMMERDWQAQCQSLLAGQATPAGGTPAGSADPAPYNLMRPRSACPACQVPIKAWHNIPVLGFLWLRGRCAACGEAISPRYPLVELATGLLSVFLVGHFGPTAEAAGALVLTWSLIALTGIDLDHHLLPDAITLPLLWAGLLFQLLAGPQPPGSPFAASLSDAVIGAVAGYLSLWLVYHAFRLATGKEGMGYGDFKLFAALGAWFGWQMLPLVILLAAASGALIGIALILVGRHRRAAPLPFGPYLAMAGLVALVWGPELVRAWLAGGPR